MSKWKDCTSYASGQRGAIAPSTWELAAGMLRIVVVRNHINNPDQWCMHCHMLRMDTVQLNIPSTASAVTAQAAALRLVRERICQLLISIDKALQKDASHE